MLRDTYAINSSWAQAGWIRRDWMITYYVFAAWANSAGAYTETVTGTTPTFSHAYRVDALPDNSYEFRYDGSVFERTPANQGWSPNEIQHFGEMKDRGDHFPGSTAQKVQFFNVMFKSAGSWQFADLTNRVQSPWSDIAAVERIDGAAFRIWDKRCSDAG